MVQVALPRGAFLKSPPPEASDSEQLIQSAVDGHKREHKVTIAEVIQVALALGTRSGALSARS